MIAIIGGGITGLSLAYFLRDNGHEVTVLEKDSQLGGNASWTNLGEFQVGIFYHIITGRDIHLLGLIKRLGIEDKLFPVKTRMGFFQSGKLTSISTPKEFLFFPPLSFMDRLRLGRLILKSRSIKNWRKLDEITASEWLIRESGEGNFKKLWQPIMNAKFGTASGSVVATDMWFRINRLTDLRGRNTGSGVYAMSGGLKVLFDRLEDKLVASGVKILKDSGVEKIEIADNRVTGVSLNNRQRLACERIISTIPLADLQGLLPDDKREYAANLSRIRYLDNICLILRLKERFSPYYQLNIAEAGFPFTGIIGADCLYPPEDFGNGYVLYISKYLTRGDSIYNMDKEQLLDHYYPYLKKINPGFDKDQVLDFSLTRRKNVEPLHTLNYSKLIPVFDSPVCNFYSMCTAQIYPEPTVLSASVEYAGRLAERYF